MDYWESFNRSREYSIGVYLVGCNKEFQPLVGVTSLSINWPTAADLIGRLVNTIDGRLIQPLRSSYIDSDSVAGLPHRLLNKE